MDQDCSIFEYMYRDAGNFKTHGRLLLGGSAPNAEGLIRGCLDWADQFVAEQVGVPSLCRMHWDAVGDGPSELDHAYHEFVRLRPMEPEDAGLLVWGDLTELVVRFQSASARWNVALSPNSDL